MTPKTHKLFIDPRVILKRHGLRPKHSWGQNFLVSEGAVHKIAKTCVDVPARKIVEIGPGLGTLTHALLQLGGQVVAVERDREMCDVLRAEFAAEPQFELFEADAATFDYAAAFGNEPGVVAGNLPYQITGRILRKVIDQEMPLVRAVFMVQEEVAARLAATHNDKARGALSLLIQRRCDVQVALRLKPTAFYPPPKVRSAVVVLTPHTRVELSETESTAFDRIVKAAFGKRRKTLRNSLLGGNLGPGELVDGMLAAARIDPQLRAEKLTLDQFVSLARTYVVKTGVS